MRILHTSDWHLGKTLESRDRRGEQEAFIDEVVAIAADEKADLVLVAGDVFDVINPPAHAEELYYDALSRLADGGKRAVVVIAGNHDQPERLTAAAPLADRLGITIFGRPKDEVASRAASSGKVSRVAAGPSWAELGIPGCGHTAVIAALPYPSEQRLNELLSVGMADADLQPAYDLRIRDLFWQLAEHYRPDTVRLAMSHLFVAGGRESDSERAIQIGGAYVVNAASLPAAAQYVALGHLHRPQEVSGAPTLARYSGSPLAYSFSEAGQDKSVVLVEADPKDARANARLIPLKSGKPLVRWQALGGISEVEAWCAQGKDATAWIDLELHLDGPLTMSDLQRIKRASDSLINIRAVLPAAITPAAAGERPSLTLEQQFVRFFQKELGTAAEPAPELLQLFLQLSGEAGDDGRTDDSEATKKVPA